MSCCRVIVTAAETSTGCVCTGPGYCQRHQCQKNEIFYQKCRHDPQYWALYERGVRMCVSDKAYVRPKWYQLAGFGDLIALVIKALTLGLVKMCDACNGRRERLNRWWRFR